MVHVRRSLRAAAVDIRGGAGAAVLDRWKFGARRELVGALVSRSDRAVGELEARLLGLRGAYAGKRCFVMGTGPSLNGMDLECLAGEHVWGLNRCFGLFDRVTWRPSFYVATDRLGLLETHPIIESTMHELSDTTFFLPVEFRLARYFQSSPMNVRWIRHRWYDVMSEDPLPDISLEALVREGVVLTYTVAVTAIQLAVFLGFSPIYLIGCDTSYTVPPAARLLHTEHGSVPTYAMPPGTSDPNHFQADYHGSGARFFAANYEQHVESFRLADRIAASHGAEVVNATVGGRLEVFPRVAFSTLFERKSSDRPKG